MGTLFDLYVRVLGDKSDVDKTIRQVKTDGEKLARQKFDIKISADKKQADAQVKALQSTLDGLQRKTVQIPIKASRIDADLEQTKRKLDELQKKRTTVTIEADRLKLDAEIRRTELALGRLEKRKVSIPVQLERASAEIRAVEAQLAGLEHKRINIPVHLDMDRIGAASSQFAGLLKIPAAIGTAGLAAGGLAALAGGLTSVAAAAAPAIGALAAIPGAALAAGQGAGVAAISFIGLGDAVKAMSASDAASATTAKTSAAARMAAAEAVRQAQSSLADAVRSQQRTEVDGAQSVRDAVAGVASARREAASQVASAEKAVAAARVTAGQRTLAAEKSLEAAQRTSKAAQADLTLARKDAVRQLEDLKVSLKGAALSEEDAQISLLRAQERLTAALKKGSGASALDIREARAGVADAAQSLVEVKRRHADITAQVAAANKAGIDGAANVVAARQKVVDSQGRERDAAKHVRDVQVTGAAAIQAAVKAVGDAQVKGAQRVAKAQESQSRARVEASRANEDAARQVVSAQHAVAIAQAQAGLAMEKQSAQASALAVAMGNISPKARIFARYLHNDLIPGLRGLQFKVQDTFFPPFQEAVKRTSSLLPIFTKGLVGTAGILGDLAGKGAAMVTTGPWKKDFATLMEGNNRVLGIFGDAALPLVGILKDLAVEALPLTERFAKFVEKVAKVAGAFISAKREGGQLAEFFQKAGDVAGQLADIVGNIAGAFYNIGKAGSKAGQGLLDSFQKATKKFKELTGAAEGQNLLKKFFDNAADSLRETGKLVNDIVLGFVHLGADRNVSGLIKQIRKELLPAVLSLVGSLTGDFGSKAVHLFTNIAHAIEKLTAGGGSLSTFVGTLSGIFEVFNKILDGPAGPFVKLLLNAAAAMAAFGVVLAPIAKIIKPIATLVGWLGKLLVPVARFLVFSPAVRAAFLAFTGPVGIAAAVIAGLAIGFVVLWKRSETFRDIVKGVLHKVADVFLWVWDKAFKPVFGWIGKGISGLITVFQNFRSIMSIIWGNVKLIFLEGADKILWAFDKIVGALAKIPGPQKHLFETAQKNIHDMRNSVERDITETRKKINAETAKMNDKTVHVGVKLSTEAKAAIAAFGNRAVIKNGQLTGLRYPGGTQKAFAQGGAVPGHGTGDTVRALLTPGEHVLTTREVKAAGGHSGVEEIRKDLRSRKRYAQGGPVLRTATDFPGGPDQAFAARILGRVRDRVGQALLSGLSQGVGIATASQQRLQQQAGTGPGPKGKFTFPLPRGSYSVGVPMGPYPSGRGFHNGQDFPVPLGTPVFSPIAGRLSVRNLGNRSYGLHDTITAGATKVILAHLSKAELPGVVRAGQLVGYSGSSGYSTGPHLHTSVFRGGKLVNPRTVLSYDRGGLMYPGQVGANFGGGGSRPERVLTPGQNDTWEQALPVLKQIAENGNGGGRTVIQHITLPTRRTALEVGRATNQALDHGWSG